MRRRDRERTEKEEEEEERQGSKKRKREQVKKKKSRAHGRSGQLVHLHLTFSSRHKSQLLRPLRSATAVLPLCMR